MSFKVSRIDHVEVVVPDRYEAARWYQQVFDLEIMSDFEFWANDASGPLMISSDGGETKLALFQGDAIGKAATIGFIRVAFHVDADGFAEFVGHMSELDLYGKDGNALSDSPSVVDHEKSWSIYFNDPYGNGFEITTYDYESVKTQLHLT